MYQEHPYFIQPANPDIKVWRYMDFTKYISLIHRSELFCCRLGLFEDKYEGAFAFMFPKNMVKSDSFVKTTRETYEHLKRVTVVSCWHMNDGESAALWKLYLSNNE